MKHNPSKCHACPQPNNWSLGHGHMYAHVRERTCTRAHMYASCCLLSAHVRELLQADALCSRNAPARAKALWFADRKAARAQRSFPAARCHLACRWPIQRFCLSQSVSCTFFLSFICLEPNISSLSLLSPFCSSSESCSIHLQLTTYLLCPPYILFIITQE